MREILFRGKRVDSGEWVYGVPIKKALVGSHDGYYPKIIPECDGRHQTVYSTAIKEETLGQYTGLKDLHGTRIFEGDVEKAISECYWRKEVAKVSFCAANCIPCEIVINSGKCEALRELVNKAAEKEGEQ